MPTIGSETYRATEPLESLTKETTISESAVVPDAVKGEDWPEAPAEIVAPTIDGLNPDSAPVPGPDVLVVVHGSGFTADSVIVWNDQDVVTVFERENKVNTTISMTAVGIDPVYVRNGDLKSNILAFTFTEAEEPTRRSRNARR